MSASAGVEAMLAQRVIVRGRVQGVGYRYAMIDAARTLRLAGWVRNRRDGTVEALVQGEPEAIEQLLAWCHSGPPGARVTAVATLPVAPDPAIDGFVHRPTE
jgi:acylphosphatase